MTPADQIDRLVAAAETHFETRVLRVRAPGGKSRGSLRVEMSNRTVICSSRDNPDRTQHEARMLKVLSPLTDKVPEYLGERDGFFFQSDVGNQRLSQIIRDMPDAGQEAAAHSAIRALFEVQAAARSCGLERDVPHMGATPEWVMSLVNDATKVPGFRQAAGPGFDRDAIADFIGTPKRQFIKWDARSGNAALGGDGTLRWFDFEFAGVRHGAEDFAWFIADEVWPLPPAHTISVIEDAFADPELSWTDYREYLEIYTVLHAAHRINSVLHGVEKKGWKPVSSILRRDSVGRNPLLVRHLTDGATWLADRHRLTAPLVPVFERLSARLSEVITPPPAPPRRSAEG